MPRCVESPAPTMGGTPIAGWFISWKIPSINGWFGGTPILGNPHLKLIDLMKLAKLSTHWSGGSSGEENPRKFRRKKSDRAVYKFAGPKALSHVLLDGLNQLLVPTYIMGYWVLLGMWWQQPAYDDIVILWYWDSTYVCMYVCMYIYNMHMMGIYRGIGI